MYRYIDVDNLTKGREILKSSKDEVILSNSKHLITIYGAEATIIILKTLQIEFSYIVKQIVLNLFSDLAAYISLLSLKEHNIAYIIDDELDKSLNNNLNKPSQN